MYAQLGTTIFDGLKSFQSFSNNEEAIIVEHALIGRRAKLQATAIGLRNLDITLFLHQEFCKVTEEIEKLRASKNSFEILPLLWGNGTIEGEFVIMSMNDSKVQMDGQGNTIAATVSVTLKENYSDDKLSQQQLQAQANAFAVGDKNPPAKSNRTNPIADNQKLTAAASAIKASTGSIDTSSRKYTNNPALNKKIESQLTVAGVNVQTLIDAAQNVNSLAHDIKDFGENCGSLKDIIDLMAQHIQHNSDVFSNPVLIPDISIVKTDNDLLQNLSRMVTASMNGIIKSAILRK